MAQRLAHLKVKEVSLVDEPANPHAKALIAKRKEPDLISKLRELIATSFGKDGSQKFEDTILPVIEKDAADFSASIARNDSQQAVWSLQSSLCSIMEDDDLDAAAKKDMMAKSFEQFLAYLGDKLATSESAMTTEQEAAEKAKKDAACDPTKKGDGEKDTGAAVVPGKTGGKPNMEDGEMTEEDMKKSLEAAVTKARAEVTAEFEKKFADQATEIQKLRDEADLRTRMEKAKALAEGQSLYTAEQLADLMKSLGEGFKVIEDTVTKAKAQQAAVNKALFAEVGTQSYGKAQTAYDKLTAAAQEIAKAEPKLTEQQAFSKAMDKHPDLYREFKASQG